MSMLSNQEDRETVRHMGLVLIALTAVVCLLSVVAAVLS